MKKSCFFLSACLLFSIYSIAQDHHHEFEVDVISTTKVKDPQTQRAIHSSEHWQEFERVHGDWYAEFNTMTGLPLRTFGHPIKHLVQNKDYESAARDFIRTKISSLKLDESDFRLTGMETKEKLTYVKFEQVHNVIPILHSEFSIRFYDDKTVPLFGVSAYDMSHAPTTEVLSKQAGSIAAKSGILKTIKSVDIGEQVYVPVESKKSYDMKLAREYTIRGQNENLPFVLKTYVDMSNGDILYRKNLVRNFSSITEPPTVAADYTFQTDVIDDPFAPSTKRLLPELKVIIRGIGQDTFFTDAQGKINGLNITAPIISEVRALGHKADVWTRSITNATVQPSRWVVLNPGQTTIDLTTYFEPAEASGYYHTTAIHNSSLARTNNSPYLPSGPMPVNVNINNSCGAYYDGVGINFFKARNGCSNTALIKDVIYHEYGHHINAHFPGMGSGISNSAIDEGYADVWAFQLTEDPVLGRGMYVANPQQFLRTYAGTPKRYPTHADGYTDGEIIAGAWWDTFINLGKDMDKMMQLFVDAASGYSEPQDIGELLRGILIEALFADDDDGNLNNGTPNDFAILSAFARHGIFLMIGAVVDHNEIDVVADQADVNIIASVSSNSTSLLQNFVGLELHYAVNNGSYQTAPLTSTSGSTYNFTIPGQPNGSLIHYYFLVEDIFGSKEVSFPFLANAPLANERNLPFSILVGFNKVLEENLDTQVGNWEVDVFGTDDALFGTWTLGSPIGTKIGNMQVQTDLDHTPNSNTNMCYFTGQGSNVDLGTTTLYSPILDLSSFPVPAIEYWRWFSNNATTNGYQDFIHVQITNDLINWVDVELTKANANQWRKKVFRVSDHVAPSSTMRIRWIAADSLDRNVFNFGLSTVEVAVDDLKVYNTSINTSSNHLNSYDELSLFPNPAHGQVQMNLPYEGDSEIQVKVYDAIGALILNVAKNYQPQIEINTSTFAQGLYSFTVESSNYRGIGKVMIIQK